MTTERASQGLQLIGAAAVLAGGALHARLALQAYGTPDLVIVFFLNAIGSAVIAALLAYRPGPLSTAAGLGISVVSLVAFGLSRTGDGVLGFRGVGLDPAPDAALSVGVEGLAVLVLVAALLASKDQIRRLATQLNPSRAAHHI
jgi:hypothetical protein